VYKIFLPIVKSLVHIEATERPSIKLHRKFDSKRWLCETHTGTAKRVLQPCTVNGRRETVRPEPWERYPTLGWALHVLYNSAVSGMEVPYVKYQGRSNLRE